MSWFADDVAAFERLDPTITTDTTRPVQVAEGVTVARRSVLWLSAAGIAALLAGRGARGQSPTAPAAQGAAGGTFLDLLKEIAPLAKAQVQSGGKGEATYLMAVAMALTKLAEPGTGTREAMRAFRREHAEDGVRFPIAAAVMDLKPGGGFRHHDHRDYNGIILGLSGELRIRNYDILGPQPVPPKGTTFQIRETRDDLILAGRYSMLGRTSENVHELVAGPEGARVLDLFTFYAKDAVSHYLTVDGKPRDAERRIHDAAWE